MVEQRFDDPKSSLWLLLFYWNGSIWGKVLPYCFLNCALLLIVLFLREKDVKFNISPEGHAIMSLIISYLVVSKVGLGYERYMLARKAIGAALYDLRELNQYILTISESDTSEVANSWRYRAKCEIIDIIDCTIDVLSDQKKTGQLARNEYSSEVDDPMLRIHALRSHLYHESLTLNMEIQLLERFRLVDILHTFTVHYERLLSLASAPFPFALVQMGRTFLFLWVFSMPLVLVGVVEELLSALQFTFFLTYGFMGLEFVAMILMHPFGNDSNQLNLNGLREAIVLGIERDSNAKLKIQQKSRGNFITFEIESSQIKGDLPTRKDEEFNKPRYHAFHHDSLDSHDDTL